MTKNKPSLSRKARGTTITDVARAAGVSIGTVSKVLNKTGNISSETRKHVEETAHELNFRPNLLAKSLHTGRSQTIGVISTDRFGRFTLPIVEGLESELQEDGISVFLCSASDDPELERRHVESLLSKSVDGLIVTARRLDYRPSVELGGVEIPVIYVYSQAQEADAVVLVPDDKGGATLATEHLIARGCQSILHITGPETFEAVRLRAEGYAETMNQNNLEHEIRYGQWSEEWGREAVSEIFEGGNFAFDGIFCGNDQIARGATEILREKNLNIPSDVAIVGFDNWTVMTDGCRPKLSSIDMNLGEVGRQAAKLIKRMIEGEEIKGLVTKSECTLVIRGSSQKQEFENSD